MTVDLTPHQQEVERLLELRRLGVEPPPDGETSFWHLLETHRVHECIDAEYLKRGDWLYTILEYSRACYIAGWDAALRAQGGQ